MKNYLLIIGSFIFLFYSCTEKGGPSNHIAGYVYQDCSMQPSVDLEVFLDQETLGLSGGDRIRASTFTDSTGYFIMEYNAYLRSASIRIFTGLSYAAILDNIPYQVLQNNPENVVCNLKPTTNIQVFLDVKNTYTQNDTLLIKKPGTFDGVTLAGPFQSGLLYVATDVQILNVEYGCTSEFIAYTINNLPGPDFNYCIDKWCNDTMKIVVPIE